ncbi:MAG TPA: Hpt domain-containing protein [Burkholderiaceae bacterium]|nr:Hpt domain-containing protein [Burkholderiaceae bacterium]
MSSSDGLDGEPLLDLQRAVDNLGGSEEAYREVAQVFLDGLPEGMRELRSAVIAGDFERGLRELHELASSLGAVGTWRAHRAARAMEMQWRAGAIADAESSLGRLEEVVLSSVSILRGELERSSGER